MIDTDKYERLTMNDMEHLELWEFSRKLFAEVKRLRAIAEDLYVYIISDAGISLKIIEEQMDWEDSPTNNWGDEE